MDPQVHREFAQVSDHAQDVSAGRAVRYVSPDRYAPIPHRYADVPYRLTSTSPTGTRSTSLTRVHTFARNEYDTYK